MDQEVRKRFHELSNVMHQHDGRILVADGRIESLERRMDKTATDEQIESLSDKIDLKLELLRSDLAPVKRAVYGLIAVIVVAVVGAMVTGVLK
jgi:hypothetical protein